jgi:hypothetical protein
MQGAYNHLFLCYRVHGPHHPDTLAALKGVEATEPQAWVPQLLAGLTWPSVEFDLDPVKGSKAEATVSAVGSQTEFVQSATTQSCQQQTVLRAPVLDAAMLGEVQQRSLTCPGGASFV